MPPTTTTSARPLRIISKPWAMDSAPDAHAATGVWTPARAVNSIPTVAAAELGINIGMVCGLTRRGPDFCIASHELSNVSAPPIPVATETPRRTGSTVVKPASAQASRAATRANCAMRSSLRASTRSSTSAGSTAATPAKFTGRSVAHSSVIVRTPD